ncbi:MAG: glycosyltransferase family 39 protein [Lachnospiraceae bacterium]|nr:glycosyltransferase family 39 protein [Lachnospiraceae bacterium]
MEEKRKVLQNDKRLQIGYLIFWSIFTFLWLYVQPFNVSPDEEMRYLIPQFIYKYEVLPHGADKAIINGIWGSSYGFNPITSYIVSALFMKVTALFTTAETALLISARLVSLLFGAANVWVVMKIAEKLFQKKRSYRWMFIIFATLLPEAIFICSYVNVDAMALFSASLTIYIWILGMESNWKYRHCAALGMSLSLCLLSYYNTYGFLLTSFFFFVGCHLMRVEKGKDKKECLISMIKGGLLVLLIVFLCSAWWFVRNYMLYDGDILGLKTNDMIAEMYAQPEFKPSNRPTPMSQGMSLFQMLFQEKWIAETGLSFIARFGFADIYIAKWMYLVVVIMFGIGLVGSCMKFKKIFWREKKVLFHWMLLLSILLTCGISAYYSYSSDFQPQGRYCMPMLTALMYFVVIGFREINERFCKDEKSQQRIIVGVVIFFWMIALLSYFVYFLPNYI